MHNDQIYDKLRKDEKMKMPDRPKASKAELKQAEEKKKKDAADKKEEEKRAAATMKVSASASFLPKIVLQLLNQLMICACLQLCPGNQNLQDCEQVGAERRRWRRRRQQHPATACVLPG
jgi:hypothetical protein